MPKAKVRAYAIIWERVRANPNKGVPVDVLDAFVTRVIKMVKNEKYYDSVYRCVKTAEGLTGLMFVSRAAHPTDSKYVRVTFLLREFSTTSESDSMYLRRYPPSADLVGLLNLETMPAITFGSGTHEFGQIY